MSQTIAYDYRDQHGELIYKAVRHPGKRFSLRRPDPDGDGWIENMQGVERLPYKLPEILGAISNGQTVYICEGEKDVETAWAKGLAATCNSEGAGKWKQEFDCYFHGATLVIVADKDAPGRRHAEDVRTKLAGVVDSVVIVECPDVGEKPVKDLTDFFEAGGNVEQLQALVQEARMLADNAGAVVRCAGSLVAPSADDGSELLQHRYLCRGGGGLLVGQSGQGKSSLAMQLAILWSLGKSCFDITPAGSLRTLIVQSENDDGDLYEMFSGICAGLNLSDDERKEAGEKILLCNEDSLAGQKFTGLLEKLVSRHSPDLLIIDPALAYLGGDTKDAEIVGEFLRRGLNPILHRHSCAALVIHHTTKLKADGPQSTHDFLYSGAGSIEWTNWARLVLALETKGKGCFALHAPKRGYRVGWHNGAGEPELVRFIRHSRKPGAICWKEVAEVELQEAVKAVGKTKTDLLVHVPVEGSIPQTVLLDKGNASGIGRNKCRAFLDELISDGTLHMWLIKRKGTNPAKHISRHQQPEPELNLQKEDQNAAA